MSNQGDLCAEFPERVVTGPLDPRSEAAGTVAVGEESCEPRVPMMEEALRADVLLRLAKAGGQVRGLSRMVSDDRYCVNVLDQIAAVQKALDRVGQMITRNYLERCAADAITRGDPLIYDELMRVLTRFSGR